MNKEMIIDVKNKLLMEMRYLYVMESKRSAHILSYDSSQALPLGVGGSSDFINITGHSGPGYCKWGSCRIDIPSWANFEFLSEGKITLVHQGTRTILRIPSGPPTWHLKLFQPSNTELLSRQDYVIVTDDREDQNHGGGDDQLYEK